MSWVVEFDESFADEVERWPLNVQNELLANVQLLQAAGPSLKRPHADTLNGSKHSNLKELRLRVGGAWRVAYAFDPVRRAILLVGGDKAGVGQKKFYKRLIEVADERFDRHLQKLKKEAREGETS